jgi:acetyl-CoA carboxylase carboxyltransferase component
MVDETSHMFITGPEVIKTVTGEDVTQEELGGAMSHASKSGVAHVVSATDEECLASIRYMLSFIPSNNFESPPYFPPADDPLRSCDTLLDLIPDSPNQPYDMHSVIKEVFDDGEFFEIHEHWARNIICGFARLAGHPVGIVANQPAVLAGTLDITSSTKGARFVRFCDAFNIPLVTFVDVPGFLPGTEQEYGGIIRHGAKLLYAFSEATVPRMTVITRKAYGGAYVVMNSKHIRADVSYAWPSAQIAVMGAEGAVGIIHRKDIAAASDADAKRTELIDDYTERFSNPYIAAERGYVDDVIKPQDTRRRLVASLEMLRSKRESIPQRKHGNIPL